MYNGNNPHCRECLCVSCAAFQRDECLEGADCCDKCDNESHTGDCPWYKEGGFN